MNAFTKSVKLMILLLALPLANATACISEAPTHNKYLFSVFNRSLMQDRFTEATDRYWKQYLGNNDATYQWNRNEIMNKARRTRDTEMITYCRNLNYYLDTSTDFNSWDYPSKSDIAKRNRTLTSLLQISKNYKGTRFRSRYALMRMRALFGLKRYQEAISYWQATGSKLQPSIYYDIMRNIYAGCLWRTGKKSQAIEIYAQQEDYVSLKYCVRRYRNLEGIKDIYSKNPNSATLVYLVQDFVNNVQETMDQYDTESNVTQEEKESIADWMKTIDAVQITRNEALNFINFAAAVAQEQKTSQPCLWLSAIGCIEHQLGKYTEARAALGNALVANGTQRMKDNARAIYAVNSVYTEPWTNEYRSWLTNEIKWIDSKSMEDRKSVTLYETDHYWDVKDRMVYKSIIPKFASLHNTNAVLAMMSMMNETSPLFDNDDARSTARGTRGYTWNSDYSNDYFLAMDSLPVDDLMKYANYLNTNPTDSLEKYALEHCYQDANYYNDIIGTKFISQGRFADAIPYLEKVNIEFLGTQNIAVYAYFRNYYVERWMTKQKIDNDPIYDESQPAISSNKKLQYCRDMLRLQQEYSSLPSGEERKEKAYELATLWYQGSYEGDCWWLERYGVSIANDSVKAGTLDFGAEAINLLNESAQSSNFQLKEKSLYALAFISNGDPWYYFVYNNQTFEEEAYARPESRQYHALSALASFATENSYSIDPYVSHCDVLNEFIRYDRGD